MMKSAIAPDGTSFRAVVHRLRALPLICILVALVSCSRPVETPVAMAPAAASISTAGSGIVVRGREQQ
jgi:hypothetical protein